MSADEVYAFAADPDAPNALVLRSADEAAKVPGLVVPALETWRPVLEAMVANVRGRPACPPPSP